MDQAIEHWRQTQAWLCRT